MKYIKVLTLGLSIIALSALIFVGTVNAQSIKRGDNVTVAKSETIDSMLFAGGNNIDIAGTVNGDVYCAGQTVTISGIINGDVICGGQSISISGIINGSLRIGGQSVTISGKITDSATIGSQTLTIDKTGMIGRDLLGGSQTTTINGTVARDIVAGAQNLTVNGNVGNNIKGGFENLLIGNSGQVGGIVEYTGPNELVINSGGKVVGEVTRTEPQTSQRPSYSVAGLAFGGFVYMLLALLALSMILVVLFPKLFEKTAMATIKKPGWAALAGFVALFGAPLAIFVIFLTVIGAPLAILTILTCMTLAIISGPVAAYLLGKLLVPKITKPALTMLIGSVLLTILLFIPIIGFITMLAVGIFGVGSVIMQTGPMFSRLKTKK